MQASFEIARLTEESGLSKTIAALQFAFWGPLTGYDSVADYEQFLCRAARSRQLPQVLVARGGTTLLGSVNLLASEMTMRPALSPWMAQLFVPAGERSRGVGSALIDAALARTAELGYRQLYLYTSGTLPGYYASRGWQAVEELEYLGKTRVVMAYELPHHSGQGTIKRR
ncbi:GNAT family N-acetyltransferase [Bradyrhizobium yuanmingense]|uniref:GNAT family N-acetyltransferase n=1 Tax=Bradyrhizobium yuanmingense TaxID=108015 RepID=UPI0023B9916E|nr:GNAT family N-acetyltransferase [Bradyrhizobium yuanmingense]MDF0518246.1 GNAT family N-acetyltransferase [Bradyrhizobium yuanmingense]